MILHFPQEPPVKIQILWYFLYQKLPCWIREDTALYSLKVQAVPRKTQAPTWVLSHQHATSARRKIHLLILSVITGSWCLDAKCRALLCTWGIVTASLCRAWEMSAAGSSLLPARVNTKVQPKECEGRRASSWDCSCNQKTAQSVPKPFEGVPARTHVSSYHMRSQDSEQVAL